MDPQATAGRMVHYTDATGRATAAIVCVDAEPDGTAALNTFFPGKPAVPMRAVPYSKEPLPGCWSWMPYQKKKAEGAGGNQSESAEPRPLTARPIPAPGTLEKFAVGLNDLNARVDALEVDAERISLASLATKEALAAAAADPSTDEVPGPNPDGSGEYPPLRSAEGHAAEMAEPPNADAEPDQVGTAAETTVRTESGLAPTPPEAVDRLEDGSIPDLPPAGADEAQG